jgi:hypothetical protein
MSTLAEFPQGIPIPDVEIRSALESVAVPGFTGVLQLEIGLRPEASACVMIGVIRRQSKRLDQESAAERQILPDPKRKKPVEKVLADLQGKLFLRPVMKAVEVHILDGVLQKITVSE